MAEVERGEIPAAVAASEVAELLTYFTERLSAYHEEERGKILSAADWSRRLHGEQKRASGDPFFIHPLSVASILVDIHMDAQGVIAALLHDVLEDTETSRTALRKEFGREVEQLVQGVTKISVLRGRSSRSIQHAETIRKMLFAMVKDVRVILIKLADKLHNMRTLGYLEVEDRTRIAKETLDIYAPLAGRLGISRIKDELEDLSLKHLQPAVYEQIRQFVADRKSERAGYLERVKEAITGEAAAAGIAIIIETRAKHFYSIYQKTRRRGKQMEERAMDAAACIGCGACVAVCKNASAMLFVAAKVSHLNLLPQGKAERDRRVLNMVRQMDKEGFGNCTVTGSCEAVCPKEISLSFIAKMNRDYGVAILKGR